MQRSRAHLWISDRIHFNVAPCKVMCVIVQHFGKAADWYHEGLGLHPLTAHDLPSTNRDLRYFKQSDWQFRPSGFFNMFYKVPPAFAFRPMNPAWVWVIHYNLLLLFLIKYMVQSYIPNAISKCICMFLQEIQMQHAINTKWTNLVSKSLWILYQH